MGRIRWGLSIVACAAVGVACSEPLAPNTELGLRVWVEASPALIHLSDTAASIRIRVFTANFGRETLRIRSGGPPYVAAGDPTLGKGFAEEYRLAHGNNPLTAGPTMDWGWDTVYVFPAAYQEYTETTLSPRQWNPDGSLPDTGTYTVRSYFNQHEGASSQFRIVP